MTEKLRQSLSAVIDDEADAFELRRVLDELGRDDGLRALWDRYHLIGHSLRGESARPASDLRERVWAALESAPDLGPVSDPQIEGPVTGTDEVGPVTVAAPRENSRLGRYTGLAVAASVAFAVVLGFNGLVGEDPVQRVGPTGVELSGVATTDPSAVADPAIGGAGSADALRPAAGGPEVSPVDVQRAQAYMLHHTQQQALNQAGVMSFVKLATYEAP